MTILWLTRLVLDPRNREVARDLASAVSLHRRIMSLFPDNVGSQARHDLGVLFRVEDGPAGSHLLIQSGHEPDIKRLPDGYGQAWTKPLTPMLDFLSPGLPLRYRIAANPIRKPGKTTRELYGLKPIVPLSGDAARQWWLRQAQQSGLHIHAAHASPLSPVGGQRARGQRIHHARCLFEGTATVADPDLLRRRVAEGIGRGKSYGCGLLSLAPAATLS
ncbi:type I-E CRISPR-associated protein Cas6/Cse3/CasE [Streptomyces sp. NPDC088147]|uniref:type I-E CRISPR-associated protein Cas6/Cse3/CasE n=1 Tax=Streptomyces sp. NPDC088147 TaxID=3365830 RepID=UPI00382AA8BE